MDQPNFKETMREWFENNRDRILSLSPETQFIPSQHERAGGYIDLDALNSEGQIMRAARIIIWPTGDCDVEFIEPGDTKWNTWQEIPASFMHYDLKESEELVDVLEAALRKVHPES